jgi:GTPase SAR1 family protein
VVFVFDITKTKTLEGLNDWHKLFIENQEAPGIVVANKIDLTNARYSFVYPERFPKHRQKSFVKITSLNTSKFRQSQVKK